MAADSLSAISSALTRSFGARLIKAWNRQAVLARLLNVVSDDGQGEAKEIAWDVAFSGATAASFAEGSDVAAGEFNQDPLIPAILPWGQYRAPFKLSNLEINAAAKNMGGPAQLANIIGLRLEGSLTKMISQINADLFTGTGLDGSSNPNIIGLQTALAPTGTYAGIAKGTYTEWSGNVLANGGVARPLTLDLLYNLEQLIFTSSGMFPSVIVTTAGVARKYAGLFETIRRTSDAGMGPIGQFNGGTMGSGQMYPSGPPAQDLFWRGIPVIRDRNCPTGNLFMITQSEMEIRPLPFAAAFANLPGGAAPTQLPSSNGNQPVNTPITCAVYPLARNGSSVPFNAEVYLNLKVSRVNAHGMLQDISEV